MALITPEYLQTKTYAAKKDRRVSQALVMQEGVLNAGDYKVSQRAAGANMSVDVAVGDAWVDGDATADQGFYHIANDAVVNVAIAANASGNPRIDQVILRAYDSADAGQGSDIPAIEVVQGTPTAAATLANRSGVAAVPATALKLADVLVINAETTISNSDIGNLRDPRAGTTGYPAVGAALSITGAPPQYAMGRPAGYVPAAEVERTANQSIGNTSDVAVTWPVEHTDNDGMHTAAASAFTVQTPGMYQVSFSVLWNGDYDMDIWFTHSGRSTAVTHSRTGSGAGTEQRRGLSMGTRAGFGDVLEFMVWQNTGSTQLVQGIASIIWCGP